ncbi:MAG: helix-turn-helix transcriptional regulator [Dehalococcoidia bacterium]|nr:MAG: helix-turn-helix transcriptional regulator [Dehalococcoidia bacterium]
MSNNRIIDIHQLTEIFKALSNTNRLRIFMRLTYCAGQIQNTKSDDQICECVGTLGNDLAIAPSTISHHLKELSHSGLITMTRRGQNVECQVNPEALNLLNTFFNEACATSITIQNDHVPGQLQA